MISPNRLYNTNNSQSPIQNPRKTANFNNNSYLSPYDSQMDSNNNTNPQNQNSFNNPLSRNLRNFGEKNPQNPVNNDERSKKKIDDLLKLNNFLREANQNLEKDTQRLATNLEALLEQNKKMSKELAMKDNDLKDFDRKLKNNEEYTKKISDDLNEKNRYIEKGEAGVKNLKEKVRDLENENNLIKTKFNEYANKLGQDQVETTTRMKQLENENLNLKQKTNFFEKNEKPGLLAKLNDQGHQIKGLLEDNREKLNKIEGQNGKIKTLEDRLKEADSRIKELEIASKFKRGLETSENQKLLHLVESAQKRELINQNRINDLESALKTQGLEMEKMLKELEKQRKINKENLSKIPNEKYNDLIDNYEKVKQENLLLRTKPSEEWKHASQLLSLKKENQNLRKKLALYQAKEFDNPVELTDPNMTPSEYIKIFENLKKRAIEAESENEKLRVSNKEEVKMMKKMHNDLIEKLEKDNSDLKKEKMELINKVNNLVDTNFKLKRLLQSKQPTDDNKWEYIYNEEVEHRRILEKNIADLETQIGNLNKENQNLGNQLAEIRGERGMNKDARIQNYEKKVKKYEENLIKLVEKYKKTEEEKRTLSLYIMKLDKERGKKVKEDLPDEMKKFINEGESQKREEIPTKSLPVDKQEELLLLLKDLIQVQNQNKTLITTQQPTTRVIREQVNSVNSTQEPQKVIYQAATPSVNYQSQQPMRVYSSNNIPKVAQNYDYVQKGIQNQPLRVSNYTNYSNNNYITTPYRGENIVRPRSRARSIDGFAIERRERDDFEPRYRGGGEVDPLSDAREVVRSAYGKVMGDLGGIY